MYHNINFYHSNNMNIINFFQNSRIKMNILIEILTNQSILEIWEEILAVAMGRLCQNIFHTCVCFRIYKCY